MKRFLMCFFFFKTLALTMAASQTVKAQCNIDSAFQAKAMTQFAKNKYQLSRSYRIEPSCRGCSTYKSYTCILTKGNTYVLEISSTEGQAQGLIAQFKDVTGEIVASNYDAVNKKSYYSVTFECNKTAPYYLNFSSVDGKKPCGVAILGFRITK